MKQKEKKLFKTLCKFKSADFDETLLNNASAPVLGQLFFNRMQGVAYGTLQNHDLLGKVNREFRNSLQSAYEQNSEKNKSFFECVSMATELIYESKCNAAMLKGAFLCAHYPKGFRTANDIDLLVNQKDVTEIGKTLSHAGFKQGNIRNGQFIPASRGEIIESKMLRGETVPYIKEVNLPYMKFMEIDINFSLDYKNGDENLISSMLGRRCLIEAYGIKIPTLDKIDFFIHLCTHLYKEATTLPWIEMRRDMSLYKYCDIYMLLNEMSSSDIDDVFIRAASLGAEEMCAYAIFETMDLFDIENTKLSEKTCAILKRNPDLILKVVSPKDNKILFYKTENITERFFSENRMKILTGGNKL
ncbi:MAG: nucleotidyltransferase family protein [Eubacteriales bacterium]